ASGSSRRCSSGSSFTGRDVSDSIPAAGPVPAPRRFPLPLVGRVVGIVIVVGALLASALTWWLTYAHPRTDDAAVRANVVGIAPHVSGPIVELHVVDNQRVKAGDLLFVVDPRPYEARLARARAEPDLTRPQVQDVEQAERSERP